MACDYCGRTGAKLRCTRCKGAYYCSREHQMKHYEDTHKLDCKIEVAMATILDEMTLRRPPPPKEATCMVCLEAGSEFIGVGCGCRGSNGWMHPKCLFELLKDKEKEELICPTCRQSPEGEMMIRITLNYWRRHRVKPMPNYRRLDAQDLLASALSAHPSVFPLTMKLLHRNIKIMTELYGPDHKHVRFAVSSLAGMYVHMNQFAQAEALLRPHVRRVSLDKNIWATDADMATFVQYATALTRLGQLDDAESLLRSGITQLSGKKKQSKTNRLAQDRIMVNQKDLMIANVQSHLADVLGLQRNFSEALTVLTTAHTALNRILGPNHHDTRSITNKLHVTRQLAAAAHGPSSSSSSSS